MSFIDRHRSLTEVYSHLLIQGREATRLIESGKAKCLHCSQQKSSHIHDGRCSTNAVSRTFRYEDQPKLDKISRAIVLVEELLEL